MELCDYIRELSSVGLMICQVRSPLCMDIGNSTVYSYNDIRQPSSVLHDPADSCKLYLLYLN